MLFLYIFGDNVEDAWGTAATSAFYLLCGRCRGGGADARPASSSPSPMVGASGAIAGVLGAYWCSIRARRSWSSNPFPLLWLFFGFFSCSRRGW